MDSQNRRRTKPSYEAPKLQNFLKGMSRSQYDTELDYDAVEVDQSIKDEEEEEEDLLKEAEMDEDMDEEIEEDEEEDFVVDSVVKAEIDKLNSSFKDFAKQYRLINKIGEGKV